MGAAVRLTVENANVAHAFAQLGYTWMGTVPCCWGIPDYEYISPAEDHPILLPGRIQPTASAPRAKKQTVLTGFIRKDDSASSSPQ